MRERRRKNRKLFWSKINNVRSVREQMTGVVSGTKILKGMITVKIGGVNIFSGC